MLWLHIWTRQGLAMGACQFSGDVGVERCRGAVRLAGCDEGRQREDRGTAESDLTKPTQGSTCTLSTANKGSVLLWARLYLPSFSMG